MTRGTGSPFTVASLLHAAQAPSQANARPFPPRPFPREHRPPRLNQSCRPRPSGRPEEPTRAVTHQHVRSVAQTPAPPSPAGEQRPWGRSAAAAAAVAAAAAARGRGQLPVPGSSAVPTHPQPLQLRGGCLSPAPRGLVLQSQRDVRVELSPEKWWCGC